MGGSSRIKLAIAWLPASLYTLLIWYLSSSAVDAPVGKMPMGDKGVHFVEYGALAVMLAHASHVSWPRDPRRFLAAGWLTVLLGLGDELHQAFVPGRSAEVPDWIADILGAVMGLVLYALARWAVRKLRGRDTHAA